MKDQFYGGVFGYILASKNNKNTECSCNDGGNHLKMLLATLKSYGEKGKYSEEDQIIKLKEIKDYVDPVTKLRLESDSEPDSEPKKSRIPFIKVFAVAINSHVKGIRDPKDITAESYRLINLTHDVSEMLPTMLLLEAIHKRLKTNFFNGPKGNVEKAWNCFRYTNSYEEGLKLANNDEAKEIYGLIAGTYYGIVGLPYNDLKNVQNSGEIMKELDEIYSNFE